MFSFDFPLFYCSVSFRNVLLSIFENVNCVPQDHQQPSLSFSMIFPLFYCYPSFSIATPSICGNAHWILKTAPQTSSSTVSTIHHQFFPILLLFSVSIAILSIFGNMHYTLKSLPNIITNSEHPPLFLALKFPLFYHYFSFTKAPISIFGSAQCPLKTVPNGVTSSEHHCWAHLCTLQPCLSDCNMCKKMTSFLLERGPLTPLQTRKIYPYHLSFTKYILRPCQHKNIFPRCDSDISGSSHQKYILTAFHWQNIFCRCDTDIIIFVWHFRVHVSKIYFRFHGFLWANIYRKYI